MNSLSNARDTVAGAYHTCVEAIAGNPHIAFWALVAPLLAWLA